MGYYGLQDRWAKREGRMIQYQFFAVFMGGIIVIHAGGQTLQEAYRDAKKRAGGLPIKRFKVSHFWHEERSVGWRS